MFLRTGAEAAGLLSERLSEAPSVRLTPLFTPRPLYSRGRVKSAVYVWGYPPGEQVPMSEPP
jgi:hypothetical protein